jgi:hypothetical protein
MDVGEHLFGRQSARAAPVLRKIVVVIPAHDEADRLPACLASVAAAADAMELPVTVLVVLDACTDDSETVAGERVWVLRVSFRNVGAARAAGSRPLRSLTRRSGWPPPMPTVWCRGGGWPTRLRTMVRRDGR